jgi:hypothetical protein
MSLKRGRLSLLLAVAGCASEVPAAPPGAPPDGSAGVDGAAPDANLLVVDGASPLLDGPLPPDVAPAPDSSRIAVDAASCTVCTNWGTAAESGRVTSPALDALSGMAASWRNPGVLYVHNDRERPEVFAVSESGALIARLTLGGAIVHDIEDMGVSRCPAGTCLFVADIGDNITPHEEFAIWRATEPALTAGASGIVMTLPAEQFAFRYADGGHNAESLIIDPTGGAVYLVTKEAAGKPSSVYHLETFETGRMNVAARLRTLTVPAAGDSPATAGSAQPCGAGFLLRTGNTLYEFRVPAGGVFADAFAATPSAVPAGVEPQGEAVTYSPGGGAYFTTGEGNQPVIHRVDCR